MKRSCILLLVLAILNMGVSIADAQVGQRPWARPLIQQQPQYKWIPDTNLRTAVREVLDLADGDRLTKAAMRDLTELSVSGSGVSDLTGLEFATNLEVLKLNNNRVSDLSALSGLENLTHLYLWKNDITDVEPLRDLTQLELLRFTDNSVSDVSALEGLVNLRSLRLKNNRVSDVSALSGLENLEDLQLAGNQITNTGALADLVSNLTKPIDIVVFPDRNLEVLVRLELGAAEDEMVTPELMAQLTRVSISSYDGIIRSLGGLEHATNLEELIFTNAHTARRDLTPLAGLAHLRHVALDGPNIALETLLSLPSLTRLSLHKDADLTDTTIVSQLTNLQRLALSFNGNLRDLTGLENMENLRHLTILGSYSASDYEVENLTAANALSDISSLSALENLEYLSLDYNGISDLSPLSALANLQELYVRHNNVSDVSPLVGLTGLTRLVLVGNPVENAHVLYPLTQQDPPVDIDIDVPVPVVEVPDAALASLLRTTLWLAADADITVANMEKLTLLLGSYQEITDLTGLEYAVNLEDLFLYFNNIVDISPLASLTNLRHLTLGYNDISDVSPLSGLVNLEDLYIKDNDISDVSPLSGLVNLERLYLKRNDISDVSPLSGLVNLLELSLENNSIVDVSPLANLVGLERLYLLENPITDTSPLEYITAVLDIEVDRNVNMPDAVLAAKVRETLGLEADTPITKPDLQNLTKLRYELYDELLDDIPNYRQLDSARAISDLTGLEHARNLTFLMCQGSTGEGIPGITDITPLTGLVQLEELFLEANTISDFTPLAGLTNLRTLALDRNHISDISGLSGLTSLDILSLNANDISDVSPLENLTNLRDLYLLYNNIRDITPLQPLLDDLTYLVLGLNPLMDTRILLPRVFKGHLDITPSEYPSWDVNEDGSIDRLDVHLVTAARGQVTEQLAIDRNNIVYGTPLAEDVNHDGIVDNADVEIIESHIRSDTLTINLSGGPTVEIALAFPGVKTGPFDITITFSEAVTGFQQSEVVFTSSGGTAEITAWNTDDNITYTATVTPTISEAASTINEAVVSEGLTIRIPAGVAVGEGNNPNIASIDTHVRIADGDIVEFTDANLAAAIRDTLNVAANQNITTGVLTILVELDANNLQINDLTGLEHATSLERLYLQNNSISELTPLGNLTSLSALRLDFNDIVSIAELQNLRSLEVASFAGNEIVDVSSLEKWSRIDTLDLRRNNITDVSPLEDLTSLISLMLTGNPILDTRPLYPLTQQNPPVDIDIAVSQYAPWDVNEDGAVDATDTALVTTAIGQSGTDILDSRTDVNADDTVDAEDLLLVTENVDVDVTDGAAPTTLGGIVNLVDTATLESLDRDVLQAQLQILRTESDGSAKYRNAIALLEAFLVATRPEETVLLANYPNPFNPETWLPYHLADASDVRITIYDTRGVVVRRLDLGHQREGYYTSRSRAAYWDGRNHVGERVASGIYFYQLEANDISRLRKMVILK